MIRISMLAAAALLVCGTADVQACSGTAGKSAALANMSVAAAPTDLSAAKKKKPAARRTARKPASGGAGGGGAPADKPSSY